MPGTMPLHSCPVSISAAARECSTEMATALRVSTWARSNTTIMRRRPAPVQIRRSRWAATARRVPVAVRVLASDQCGGSVSCRIVNVTSNEPVDGLGDGDTSLDWEITGYLTVNLRAERAGKGTGRVYTIKIVCVDTSGNQATSTVTVTVPKS